MSLVPTAHDLARRLDAGELSSVEVTRACLERERATRFLGAYLHVDAEGALRQAELADERRARGRRRGPLDGIPVALKDNVLVAGLPATCASELLAGFVAPYDAAVAGKLAAAGAVVLGKLNMDELAMGSSTEYSARHAARNPWDPERVPGGSSGGSAIAVAVGSAVATLGTDTGGSVRQPAALCGVVGLQPTYGRVSRFGVVAFASSLDRVGPLARDVTDCALVLQAVAGHDARDATSADVPVPDYRSELEAGVAGLRLGVPREYFVSGIDPEVGAAVDAAVREYERLGARLVEVSLATTEHAAAAYYLIAAAEASTNLARYDGVRYGRRIDPGAGLRAMYEATRALFGREVKRRIMLGTYALSAGYYEAYYAKAQKVRTLVCRDFARAFAGCDALVTPTTPGPAFPLGEKLDDPVEMYRADVFTVSSSLAGLPALSLPCGFTRAGLPIGMQLIGPQLAEARLLRIARAYEREHDWHMRAPPGGSNAP